MIRRRFFIYSALCFCLLIPAASYSQTALATLNGRVLDSSNAAIPNVTVEVMNVATNQALKVVTDGAGNYTAPFLNPGSYSVTVEARGFKKFIRTGLTLGVNQ